MGGHRSGGAPGLFLEEELLLSLQEPPPFLGEFGAGRRDGLLFADQLLLPVHQDAVPFNLRLQRGLLILEELDDLFLAACDLRLAGGDVPRVGDRLGVSVGNLFLALQECLQASPEVLLPTDELVLFREDLLPRSLELLLLLGDVAFLELEFFLARPEALLPADEGVALVRERGALLLGEAAVFLDPRRLLLEGRLAFLVLRVSGLQAFFELFQCVQGV